MNNEIERLGDNLKKELIKSQNENIEDIKDENNDINRFLNNKLKI